MPILTATQIFDIVRGLVNDVNAELWTDTVLLTRLPLPHYALQSALRLADCPVMKKRSSAITVASGNTTVTLPSDLIEPIELRENTVAGGYTTANPVTYQDPLPAASAAATLVYWQWDGAAVNLVAASANRDVFIDYWRRITVPVAGANSIGVHDAELYLAPALAATAAGSVGQQAVFEAMSSLAESGLSSIIALNKGRSSGASRP